ncbi:hypothetical protein BC939DRAFT_478871 [Gamsiella multidivaricata]|uniref:uncharacterized protein n=1 Tax=Gamsiella multidivaricata TaxID=101098 RepID=UPI00222109A8|nr:uncharacterized protein BC939DRAFT_478871 [Gamsiella multidivaricata]KAG0359300.1 hypothetical protein BGZ54_010018 [Gamsiella multidivaricata]KAI7820554.1 hypothetical protein BC939DRAFT_478871 [Gamsiella multidivaricata]
MPSTPDLPLEIWFQILNQTLSLLLPIATTPRLYSTHILPLLLTSHTFYEHCHPLTHPHLRKHRLLQLFTRWKAAHSREVHFYHHPLRNHVRYALPDRVGNPPGEEYETLYSFIKRAYLFGCESVCGTVIPVEGGLEPPVLTPSASAPEAPAPAQGNNTNEGTVNPTVTNHSTPASATGTGVSAGVVLAPPPAQVSAPLTTHHGGDGGGQGWKNHALQWHVANPTFAAEGTIELYRDVVEEYRRVVCGSAAARERHREIERAMDMMRNPHRYTEHSVAEYQCQKDDTIAEEDNAEADDEGEGEEEEEEEEDDNEMIEQNTNELLSEIEAKGGLRRRDSGHGQSSSEMDIDDDMDEEDDEDMMCVGKRGREEKMLADLELAKRGSQTTSMDYQLESGSSSSHRHGMRNRKLERSVSAGEQEQIIMDMALDKHCHPMSPSVEPLYSLETKPYGSSSPSSSSSSLGQTRSGSPAPFTRPAPPSRKTRENGSYSRSRFSRTLQRSHSSPGTTDAARIPSLPLFSSARFFGNPSSHPSSLPQPSPSDPFPASQNTNNNSNNTSILAPLSKSSLSETSSQQQQQQQQQQTRPLKAEDLDFDLASACANTFASDLAFVLARVPGLGAHFHRFEQLAKLKLHVGWAKHAQSRGGNDVFVMSCSRLISLLAPLANTPLVSERAG